MTQKTRMRQDDQTELAAPNAGRQRLAVWRVNVKAESRLHAHEMRLQSCIQMVHTCSISPHKSRRSANACGGTGNDGRARTCHKGTQDCSGAYSFSGKAIRDKANALLG